jgi:hypothetical protein
LHGTGKIVNQKKKMLVQQVTLQQAQLHTKNLSSDQTHLQQLISQNQAQGHNPSILALKNDPQLSGRIVVINNNNTNINIHQAPHGHGSHIGQMGSSSTFHGIQNIQNIVNQIQDSSMKSLQQQDNNRQQAQAQYQIYHNNYRQADNSAHLREGTQAAKPASSSATSVNQMGMSSQQKRVNNRVQSVNSSQVRMGSLNSQQNGPQGKVGKHVKNRSINGAGVLQQQAPLQQHQGDKAASNFLNSERSSFMQHQQNPQNLNIYNDSTSQQVPNYNVQSSSATVLNSDGSNS